MDSLQDTEQAPHPAVRVAGPRVAEPAGASPLQAAPEFVRRLAWQLPRTGKTKTPKAQCATQESPSWNLF